MPLVILVVLIYLIASALSGLDATDAPLPTPERDKVEVAADDQLKLAEEYRPILLFDSGENWRPLNVDDFFDDPGSEPNRLCRRGENPRTCPPIPGRKTFLDPASQGKDLFIDIGGERPNGADFEGPRSDCPERAEPLRDCNAGPGTAIYYEVKQANGRFYIDYWWFLRYNEFRKGGRLTECSAKFRPGCGDHEGDWEGITVVTSAFEPGEIEYVTYAEHSGDFRYARPQFEVGGRNDKRPLVFVADGSHASYPGECGGEDCAQLLPLSLGFRLPEGRHDGRAAWGRNAGEDCSAGPVSCLLPLSEAAESWNAFGGLWGLDCGEGGPDCPVNPGPHSPSAQDRFKYPWCYQRVLPSGGDFERSASCDVAAAVADPAAAPGAATQTDCRAWAGGNVAILACDSGALATGLADEETSGSSGISIVVTNDAHDDPSTPPTSEVIGKTVTRGVSQVVDKVLRAPYYFTVRGKVTEVIVRGRASDGSLLEALFAGLDLKRGDLTAFELQERDGRLNFFMRLPDGSPLEPTRLTTLD